jgi:phage protein U
MSGPQVMMTLGGFKFQLSSAVYQEFKRSTEYRWPKQDRFGRAPVRQYTGYGDDTITLSGVVYPGWNGGRQQVDALRDLAGQGEPLMMVAGDGTVMGRWVVDKVDEGQTIFGPAGAALRQEFTLNLSKFDDEAPQAMSLAQLSSGTTLTATGMTGAAVDAAGSAAGIAGSAISGLNAAVANIQGIAGQVQQTMAPAIAAVRQGMTVAANIKNAAKEAQALVKRLKGINSLADAEGALGSLMRVSSSASAVSTGAGKVLGTTLGQLNAEGAPPAAVAAVKGALVTVNKLTTGVTAIRQQTDSIVNSFKKIG